MSATLEFVWTAEDFEDLLADNLADQRELAFEEYVQSPDFDVWAHLETWRGEEHDQCSRTS